MQYQSTRDRSLRVSSAQAIARGISADKGLFVPTEFPQITLADLERMSSESYTDRAKFVLGKYLTDFSAEELADCVDSAYTTQKFRDTAIAPLKPLHDNAYVLELWHGPTCAFKDMALQILPHFMRYSVAKAGNGEEVVILVATSGDTGKAALEGFCDAPNTRILVFYPDQGVSKMQKLQMATQEGKNVGVFAIRGNFDDAQNGVKAIFTDKATGDLLADNGKKFSSANSINWGRLCPQIVYYVSAYCDLLNAGALKNGEPMNVVVPTGNFGNILAAYYAKKMGVPIKKLICASNQNRVLTDFFESGTYDRRREFYATTSPSMDILISSNLERLLFDLCDGDDNEVKAWMEALVSDGNYTVSDKVRAALDAQFASGSCDEAKTAAVIRDTFEKYGYLIDTHTAVAVGVCEDYLAETGDKTPTVIASTANPYKFPASVLTALCNTAPEDDFACADALEEKSGVEMPAPLKTLKGKPVRFTTVCDKAEMRREVLSTLGIDGE